MKVIEEEQTIELTRRNLLALLAKLDGNPRDSACLIGSPNRDSAGRIWWVKAVENEAHYSDRAPGRMHPGTEEVVRAGRSLFEEAERADDAQGCFVAAEGLDPRVGGVGYGRPITVYVGVANGPRNAQPPFVETPWREWLAGLGGVNAG